MARTIEPVCRLCRREGVKLFLKGSRCHTPKCSITKRSYPPGMHRWRRGKRSEYCAQLREKQKVKRFYGVLETQFRRYFGEASRLVGNTGMRLMQLFELRLDNVVTRLGFAPSRAAARQLIRHGHVSVNGKTVDIPSYPCAANDIIAPKKRERSVVLVKKNTEANKFNTIPGWLEVDADNAQGKVKSVPQTPDEFAVEAKASLIIELLSK